MLVVGLTGGIASGKSTISRYLRELGAAIIDADVLARELVLPHSPAWQEIVYYFGAEILDSDGFLQRKKLGKLIFQSAAERKVLNQILHPKIKDKTIELIKFYQQKKDIPLVVVVAPLLIEAKMTEMVDEIWLVVISEELQLQRLKQRDNLSTLEAQKRIAAQLPLQEKLKYASRVIDNSGSREETRQKVLALWQQAVEDSISQEGRS
ncbi:MAG: dephospho-CoA kinase [Clostridia bacterium]|nr:dephospho-CoA kinase [Clostridia bacterium]